MLNYPVSIRATTSWVEIDKIAFFQKEAGGVVAGWNFMQLWDDSLVALHVFVWLNEGAPEQDLIVNHRLSYKQDIINTNNLFQYFG